MDGTQAPAWTPTLLETWRRIAAHAFEPPHALNFTARLARDKGWPLPFARAAITEYRRFCLLCLSGGGEVTPSEQVDEVWHQHLTYSRDYWDVWCATVLRAPLHHGPTQGGPAENTRFRQQYAATLARYERFFGPPDPAFWPATRDRFRGAPRYRMIDADRWLVLPNPRWLLRRWGPS